MAQDASSKPTHPSFFGSSSSGGGGGGGPQSTITNTTPPTEPEPFVIPPSHPTGRHTHTLIVLHGRGDTGPRFGSGLISARTSSSSSPNSSHTTTTTSNSSKRLIDHLRTTRLVFPTAPHVSPTTGLTQWYENFSLADPTQRKAAQRAGLAATGALLARLARREARLVGGLDRVVIGGLSQGCAAALVFFLGFHDEEEEKEGQDEALGGFFGFSGWLPFADELDPAARWEMGSDERVAAGDEEKGEDEEWMTRRQTKAANIARSVASLPPLRLEPGESPAFARTPVFLGHGRRDRHVEMRLGAQAGDVLVDLGCDVRWEEYDEEHWWKEPEQIDDLVEFLRDAVGVEMT